ncbi:hypothetical protein MBLNU230_g7609t1 [Neophaeotheca triangularis]
MALLASTLNILGALFLSHAIYSSYEHSLLQTTTTEPSPLPLDILLETLLSTLLLCTGIVLSSQPLKPLQMHLWAGRLEKRKDARVVSKFGDVGGNPYAGLEERVGFLDVRGRRREFGDWVREGGK